MSRKTPILALLLLTVCLIPRMGRASTVTLELESTDNSIFPYGFEINESKTLYDLSCLNDKRSNSLEESWTATAVNLGALISTPGNTTATVIGGISIGKLEEDAYLDSKYINNPSNPSYTVNNIEVQDAIWSILDGTHVYDDISGPNTNTEKTAVDNFITAAASTAESASFYSEFTYYYPKTWSTDCDPDKIPQQFLGHGTPPVLTPEPSSLMLMGTGIVGLAGAMRRRWMASSQA